MSPEPPPPLPPSAEVQPPAPARDKESAPRLGAWVWLVTLLTATGALMVGLTIANFAEEGARPPVSLGVFALAAAALAIGATIIGWRRGWATRRRITWGNRVLALLSIGVLGQLFSWTKRSMQRDREDVEVSCCLAFFKASADQFFLENGNRFFVTFDELVGPDRYVRTMSTAADNPYRALFPLHQDTSVLDFMQIRLPDGRKAPSGKHRHGTPPPDGVHTTRFGYDTRLEVTYRGGVPHGPLRAYSRDGQLWAQANYVNGRIIGPCWNQAMGERFDENVPSARHPLREGQRKLSERDYAGAMREFAGALRLEPNNGEALRGIAEAKAATNDLDGAIADYTRAARLLASRPEGADILTKLRALQEARPAQKVAQGNDRRADADIRRTLRQSVPGLIERAYQKSGQRDFAGAVADFTTVIELVPVAVHYSHRAGALRALGDLDRALADYTRAIELDVKFWPARLDRAHLRRQQQDLPGAVEDFRALVDTAVAPFNAATGTAAFWLYFTECERGWANEARGELDQFSSKLAAAKVPATADGATALAWLQAITDFVLGRSSEPPLLPSLAKLAPKAQEYYRFRTLLFWAMRQRQGGETAAALDRFRQALAVPGPARFEWEREEARRAVAALERKGP